MKTKGWLIAVLVVPVVIPLAARSQCGTIHTVTYDTVITGLGANEDPYLFSFPLFDATLGTLTDVNVSSTITVNYDYNIENTAATGTNFRMKIIRNDDVVSPLLPGGGLSFSQTFPNAMNAPINATNYYMHALSAADNFAGTGSDYADSSLVLLNTATVISSAVNAVNFVGTGTTTFEYYTSLGNSTWNGSNVLFNPTASDQITLSVTYTYCDNIVLESTTRPTVRPPAQVSALNRRLYPNPSIDGRFSLQFGVRGDWQVDVLTTTGQIVNRKFFPDSSTATMAGNQLTPGIYLIRATNKRTQEGFTERLVIR